MRISFFEEFPTRENLAKRKLFPSSKLYVAARSLNEFQSFGLRNAVYWPVLEKKEGYWISPLAKRSALERVLQELEGKTVPILLDLELPRDPWLYLKQAAASSGSRRLILDFTRSYQGMINTAEYYPGEWTKDLLLSILGLHYENHNVQVIQMIYHSLHQFDEGTFRKQLRRGKKRFGKNFAVGLGTIASGILGDEPLLSPQDLARDLRIAKEERVEEVVIFRLGGVNEDYVGVIKNA